MTEFKWQIDTIRTVLFSNEKFKFQKKEWSKIITGLDISNEMTQEENGVATQYVEITNLDQNRQFNLVHIEGQNIIDLQLVFERNKEYYSYAEIAKEVESFFEKNKSLFNNLNENIIRVGNVVELSIPIEDERIGCNLLKRNVSYFSNIDDDLNEISFRSNKSYIYNNIKINQVIQYANGQKMSLVIDPQMGIPKATVQKNILMNIDVNTDASHRSKLDLNDFSSSLQDAILTLIKNGGSYVN
ncbi:hypothetical protein [Acinetobacter ursingii]|jgi:hypothetical protein|uniref:hypothetical protein n=1 Tax=Acinetobacter ursingii TaxID=108980 RepID=UPI0002CED597|nr:hypothetical protein [Acinetobacter ursingii]ECE6725814.1 hypothetical protein [Salmonella enterica subsp. enterica serovar Paratyphi A]ENX45728.1 hypothetical protein F943_03226 [Acinetobacter ursingii NIPH 706]MCH2017272.1 hypothetical protein [Acinetobacter ursingii]MCU4524850.1 hypothetical protein [Acinetobacter ursingii]MCU4590089.1 hypothetical protein [Acinetobacter ursingii]